MPELDWSLFEEAVVASLEVATKGLNAMPVGKYVLEAVEARARHFGDSWMPKIQSVDDDVMLLAMAAVGMRARLMKKYRHFLAQLSDRYLELIMKHSGERKKADGAAEVVAKTPLSNSNNNKAWSSREK